MGSFVPWLYYSFYCSPQPCFIYLIVVCILGLAAITVSQCDFFATPQYRGVRAGRKTAAALPCRRSGDVLIFNGFFFSGVFVGLGLSGVVPTLHFVISEGLFKATTMGQMGWLLLMAALYITGACLYAARIPERFFPGKCDIWVSRSGSLFFFLLPSHIERVSLSAISSSTPTSCSTSWWSQERLFISTECPTSRNSASQQEGAAPRTAPSNAPDARARAHFHPDR